MSRRIDHDKHRYRGKETDEAIERALTPAGKPRPAWGRPADRRKAELAQRLIDSGRVQVTKLPPGPRPDGKEQRSKLTREMKAKVAAALKKVAAQRKAREKQGGR